LVADNTGVVKLVELVCNAVPNVATSNQSIVLPEGAIADIATVPAPQRLPGTAVDKPGIALIVAVTGVLVVDTQPVVVFLLST
jgi:type III secretory pathway lipoprotein EscJ